MKTIAVYGSLKQYKYNHDMIAGSKRVGRSYLRGIMWLISTYPAFKLSNTGEEGERDHTFELYEVEDEAYERVRDMELGAGYDEIVEKFKVGEEKEVEATLYVAGKELEEYCVKNRPVVRGY